MNKINYFIIRHFWIIYILGTTFNLGILGYSWHYANVKCESCMLYNLNVTQGLGGIYYPSKDFYCVWKTGRTEDEINQTDYHEYCHYLIDIDKKNHFCKNKL